MLFDIANTLKDNLYLISTIVITLDAIPGISLIMPEELVIAGAGFYTRGNLSSLIAVFLLIFMLLFVRQLVVYYIANKFKGPLLGFLKKVFRLNDNQIDAANDFVCNRGFWINVGARMSSTTRSILAIVSGVFDFPIKRFIRIEIFVAFLTAVIFGSLGYFFKGAFGDLKSSLEKLTIFLFAIVVADIIIAFTTYNPVKDNKKE